jgi:hypothetical protein
MLIEVNIQARFSIAIWITESLFRMWKSKIFSTIGFTIFPESHQEILPVFQVH